MADNRFHKEQLNVLEEYNFNTVIACVQSFDREVVKQQKRRAPKNDDVIFEFIDHATYLGLFTMSDIILFDTGDLNRDLDRLSLDMKKLADHDISEMSVQTIFDEEGKYDVQVSSRVNEFLNLNPQYGKLSNHNPTNHFADESGQKRLKEDKIFKKDISWNDMSVQDACLDGLMTDPLMLAQSNYNVLGIGSYKNHKHTFSRIEDNLEYIEMGDTYTPKWMCTYDKKDWPMKKLVANFYEFLEDTIGDPPDGVDFTFSSEVAQHDEDDSKKKSVTRNLIPIDFKWPNNPNENYIIIEEYISKLKKLFDDPNFYRSTRDKF